ncbi:MAG: GNAT family N-acetyltransferase [Actinomycetota bacterium]|nr:GNAT family N-acetyltransferase [Actinomycetota bacterium]
MRVRLAGLDDLDAVCALRLRFMAEHRGVHPRDVPPDFEPRTREFLERHERAGTIRSWLAEHDDGHHVGVLSMLLLDMAPMPDDPRSTDGYLINMYVEPTERGAGLGRRLLECCVASAQELGVHRLLLFTTPDGRPLYESAGFVADADWLDVRLPRREG